MPRLKPDTAKQRAANLVKSLNKHKGNRSAVARELGVSPQTLNERTKQPAVQEALQQVKNKCLADAGITLGKIYGQLASQLIATREVGTGKNKKQLPIWSVQDSARESALELAGHKNKKADAIGEDELTESLKHADLEKLKKLVCLLK